MIKRYAILVLLVLMGLILPQTAWALQAHGGPEGLHVHQLAHGFFAFAMGLLIYWLRKWKLASLAGWRSIQFAALFFIFWNINAIVGHWLEELSALLLIRRIGAVQIELLPGSGVEWLAVLYYLAKLDHVWCVPALFFLLLGLRCLYRQSPFPHKEDGAT